MCVCVQDETRQRGADEVTWNQSRVSRIRTYSVCVCKEEKAESKHHASQHTSLLHTVRVCVSDVARAPGAPCDCVMTAPAGGAGPHYTVCAL